MGEWKTQRKTNTVPHSGHRLVVVGPSPQQFMVQCLFLNYKCSALEVKNEILNISLAESQDHNGYHILIYSYSCQKSLFSITQSLITLLGNHLSFHFIALRYKINVISLPQKTTTTTTTTTTKCIHVQYATQQGTPKCRKGHTMSKLCSIESRFTWKLIKEINN